MLISSISLSRIQSSFGYSKEQSATASWRSDVDPGVHPAAGSSIDTKRFELLGLGLQ